MLTIQNVTKRFGDFTALNELTMTVPDGCVYGLVGPNGAGKSTLIRHLTGIYRCDSGEITLDGEAIDENPAVKARIGYIPDDIFYFPQANMEEMARFYAGMYPNFDRKLYDALEDVFHLPTGPIRRFSKGMQKQAAFRLAICTRPDLLILDEPVDGLDPVMRRQVMSLILSEVAERGTTVLISSHNLRELEDVCDHVGIMDKGRMLLERSLDDMQASTVKVQTTSVAPEGLDVLHASSLGRLNTFIIHATEDQVQQALAAQHPDYCDILPLSLEEIFIYELGGVNYEVKNIVL